MKSGFKITFTFARLTLRHGNNKLGHAELHYATMQSTHHLRRVSQRTEGIEAHLSPRQVVIYRSEV